MLALLIALYVLLTVGLQVYLTSFIESHAEEIKQIQSYQIDLGKEASKFEIPKIGNLPAQVAVANTWQWELVGLNQLAIEHAKVESQFKLEVAAYLDTVHASLKKSPFKDGRVAELKELTFAEMQDIDGYIAGLKTELRAFIVKANQSAKSPQRFEVDIDIYLSQMSIKEKVWQMLVPTVSGVELTSSETRLLKNNRPGGIVFLGQNVQDKSQLKALTNSIQLTNPELLVFTLIDQEGGTVKRIWWDETPSQRQMASLSQEAACAEYQKRDRILWNSGINFNLGIVADVTSDPNSFIYPRVFSGDYQEAASLVSTAVMCTQKGINTLKHYPGHGATTLDTHKGLATLDLSKKTWKSTHLLPFTEIDETAAVMTGHLLLPAIDKEQPASLSAKQIKYIRQTVDHSGLIITDDMRMLEAAGMDRKQVAQLALNAGNDILLYSLPISDVKVVGDWLVKQVRSGEISESKLDNALKRILKAKNNLLLSDEGALPAELLW